MQRFLSNQRPPMNVLPINQLRTCHQPNWSFNANANTGHAFGILMACIGTLRTSCSGAG